MDCIIRPARLEDATALAAIYAPYVLETAVTFEYEPPDATAFRRRMEAIQGRYPYLVAEQAGEVLGYAYAAPFHDRAAFAWVAEPSIYLRRDARGQGLGSALYARLEELLRSQGIVSLCALIADAPAEDAYITHASLRFHARQGFTELGRYPRCGYKFGRWYDLVWMEKALVSRTAASSAL
ncbi:MAG: N-acetyltransferase family protein [Clostridiales bacterium]|nr:N-acetyltransferase family protein [Clostridiales bacterium]